MSVPRINWMNPLTQRMRVATLAPNPINLAKGWKEASERNPVTAPSGFSGGRHGKYFSFGSTSSAFLNAVSQADLEAGIYGSTFIFHKRKRDMTNRSNCYGASLVSNARYDFDIPDNTGTAFVVIGSYSVNTNASAGGLIYGDDWWGITHGPRGTEIWQNGFRRAISANQNTTRWAGGNTGLGLNTFQGASTNGDIADHAGWMYWAHQLSMPAMTELTSNPYQLFERNVFRTYSIPYRAPVVQSSTRRRFIFIS